MQLTAKVYKNMFVDVVSDTVLHKDMCRNGYNNVTELKTVICTPSVNSYLPIIPTHFGESI